MSLLIKGMDMEMPQNCCECPLNMVLCNHGYKYLYYHPELYDKRADDCPIMKVPPHGDLIDRDALSKQLGITDMHCLKCALGNYGLCTRGPEFVVACKEIEDAPTIIDAENK